MLGQLDQKPEDSELIWEFLIEWKYHSAQAINNLAEFDPPLSLELINKDLEEHVNHIDELVVDATLHVEGLRCDS